MSEAMQTTKSGLRDRLDGVIDAAIGGATIVGTVVLVAEDGEVIYSRAAGFADREAGIPVQPDTIFRLASVTKPMVAATALALVEDGAIALGDPVTRYLPDFRPKLADGSEPVITLRHLLTHTSGLRYGYPPEAEISEGMDRPGRSMAENLARIAAQPLDFAPGTNWFYSVAIDVLGGALERATGRSLPDLVAAKITGPLGMTDTAFHVVDRTRLATAYADGTPPKPMAAHEVVAGLNGPIHFAPDRIFDPASFPSGGAGMAGTAGDFLRFLDTVRQGGAPILSPESFALLSTDALGEPGTGLPGVGFSLGWSILLDPALAETPATAGSWRWGGVYGHDWLVDPARRLTVVSFSNTAVEGCTGAYPKAITRAVYG